MARILLMLFSLASMAGIFGTTTGSKTGTITGRVVDSSGAPIIGAIARLEGTKMGALAKRPDGAFRITGVRPGTYTVAVSAIGVVDKTRRPVTVVADSIADIGTVVLSNLRVEGKNVMVTGERKARNESALCFTTRGGRAKGTSVRVDGVSAEDAYVGGYGSTAAPQYPTVSSLAVQEVQAAPSKFSAEYGDVISGVVNSAGSVQGTAAPEPQPAPDRSGENYAHVPENEFLPAHTSPISTFSIDVDRASYSTIRSFLEGGTLPPADAVRIEEMVNYFDYDYPDPEGEHPFGINTDMSECPWEKSHRLVRIGLQGKRMQTGELPPSNLTFLIDVSGSMEDANKLPLLKEGMNILVDQLRPQDSVAIVVYAGAAGQVLPMTSGADRDRIRSAIDVLQAGGSTAGGEGIELAYATARASFNPAANNRVILATDGDFNVGVSDEKGLISLIEEKRKEGIFLTVLGFGTGNYQDAKMEQLADHGNGNFFYIDRIEEARKVFVGELGGTLVTIAKDVKIQVLFSPERVESYRLIGYENRMLATEDFDDDAKDAGELGAGHSVTALYEIVLRGEGSTDLGTWQGKRDTLDMPGDWKEGEMMRIRLRYKLPDSDVSTLIEGPVIDRGTPIERSSKDFRFAAAVAEFGLMLRDSRHKANSSYDNVLWLANGATGDDRFGYRAGFVSLIEKAKKLKEVSASR